MERHEFEIFRTEDPSPVAYAFSTRALRNSVETWASIQRPVFYSSEILLMLTQHRVTNGSIVNSLIDLMQNFWVDIDEKRRSFQNI